ncbi:MAG: hypothetical protein GY780_03950 [bacterium]|nr:hypothetical protein [bacterium]
MNKDKKHEEFKKLILGYEDLVDNDRLLADKHLLNCVSCREMLTNLQKVERESFQSEGLSLEKPLHGLPEEDHRQAQKSLNELKKKNSQSKPGKNPRRLIPWVPLALAASLLLVFFVSPLSNDNNIQNFQMGSPLVLRGESGSGTLQYGVSFQLKRAGYPVLFHLDGAGEIRIISPDPGRNILIAEPGKWHYLPFVELDSNGSSKNEWRKDLASGPETYLLSVSELSPPNKQQLEKILTEISENSQIVDRNERVRQLQDRLPDYMGPLKRIDSP